MSRDQKFDTINEFIGLVLSNLVRNEEILAKIGLCCATVNKCPVPNKDDQGGFFSKINYRPWTAIRNLTAIFFFQIGP